MNGQMRFRSSTGASDRVLVILLVLLVALFIRSVAAELMGRRENGRQVAQVTTVVPAQPERAASVPVRLRIPVIGVDADVQAVGLTPNGQMDVPKGETRYEDVGWYSLGAKPGEIGTAVMDGHLDTYSLIDPGVFRDLDELIPGDIIEVVDDRGTLFRFRVTGSVVLEAGADSRQVFESNSGKAHLNLITCSGDWKQDERQYDRRLVVFTELVP